MISTNHPIPAKFHSRQPTCSDENYICSQCGGNGYMKTTPNCYHTCLACLGRGISTSKDSE